MGLLDRRQQGQQAPALAATVYALPATAAVIRRRHAQRQAPTAFQIVEGNFLVDPYPRNATLCCWRM